MQTGMWRDICVQSPEKLKMSHRRVFFNRRVVVQFSEPGLEYKRAVLLQFSLMCVTTESYVNQLEVDKVGAAVVMVRALVRFQ